MFSAMHRTGLWQNTMQSPKQQIALLPSDFWILCVMEAKVARSAGKTARWIAGPPVTLSRFRLCRWLSCWS